MVRDVCLTQEEIDEILLSIDYRVSLSGDSLPVSESLFNQLLPYASDRVKQNYGYAGDINELFDRKMKELEERYSEGFKAYLKSVSFE